MAAYAILVGIKEGKKKAIAFDSPPEIRKRFRKSDGEGFERLEVIDTYQGRTRGRSFLSKPPKKTRKAKPKAKPDDDLDLSV